MKKPFLSILYILISIFAIIGFVFSVVFFGMRYGIFNVRGSIDERNHFFSQINSNPNTETKKVAQSKPCVSEIAGMCKWDKTPEWVVVEGGLTKDAEVIARVSRETGVSGRMIAAVVVPEQIRFFTANREVFKRYFEPLKILGSMSQFSLGISGIKQNTALLIEEHASNPNSPFYPGPDMDILIAYKEGVDHDTELYNRLTDSKNHYYSYLYTALYIKEIQMQWKRAGFEISQSPEAVVTLFNLGFSLSKPNAYPMPGGAPVTIGGKIYSYGELGSAFYRSDVLKDIFPN